MFRDLRDEPLTGEIETDLCVIGAGAAGLTIARRFEGTGVRVCLIESGGMEADEAQEDLYRGENAAENYGIETTRLRYFGGTLNHWTGVCGPLDPLDFEPRPWVGSIGWPITRDELMPYYRTANDVLDLGEFEYDPRRAAPTRRFPDFDPDKLVLRLLRFSQPPTRLGEKYGPSIEASENVLCLLHANVVDFETDRNASRIAAVRVATLDGDEGTVRARVFVLACGGLENPRLLLNASATPRGLGNEHGHVGRYFADHIHHRDTGIVVTQGEWWRSLQRLDIGSSVTTPTICLGEGVQKQRGLLNSRVGLWRADPPPAGIREGVTCLGIYGTCEQLPASDNRVELSDERDALGLRRVRLHWTVAEEARKTMKQAAVVLAEELGRLRLGFVRLDTKLDPRPGFARRVWWASHHLGTTRMSEMPEGGVVDPDCRVHSVDNLYIAGSSVFPAAGQINPTLTIVALALRLCDHLSQRLG